MVEASRLLDANASRVLDYLISRLPRVVAGRPETYPTYKQVHDALGLEMMGSTYGESLKVQGLESLASWSAARGLPAITGLVVESEARMPARGFFRIHDRPEDDFAWWTAEIAKCKETDWTAVIANATSPAETVSEPTAQRLSHRDRQLSLDSEFENFLAGFLRRESGHWLDWLPGYTEAVESIRAAIQSGNLADAARLVWRPQDNGVANAGPGVLASKAIDGVFEELQEIVAAIAEDQSAESYLRVSKRVWELKEQGRLPRYPRLLIARAFASIAPDRYHTTVDAQKHDRVIAWVEQHSAFRAPVTDNWAEKAAALVRFLSRIDDLNESMLARNMFPWFVYGQIARDARGRPEFVPGFTPRAAAAVAHLPAETRSIVLRHNVLSDKLYRQLVDLYGKESVGFDQKSGRGGWVDALVLAPNDEVWIYEIKIARTASAAVREAIGQLLEYGFHSGGWNPSKLIVVAEPALDRETGEYLARLRDRFGLPLEYLALED